MSIPDIHPFQNLTLKIQRQGHGWGQSSKSQSGSDFLSTRIPFTPSKSVIPFLWYGFKKQLTSKILCQQHSPWSHSRSNIVSTHIRVVPCQSALPFLRYVYFKIWASKVKVWREWRQGFSREVEKSIQCGIMYAKFGGEAALLRCLSHFRAIWALWHPISRLRNFTGFGGQTSYRLVNRGPGVVANLLGPLILTWFNFNPSMDKQLHPL